MPIVVIFDGFSRLLEEVIGGMLDNSEVHIVRQSHAGNSCGGIGIAALTAGADAAVVARDDPSTLGGVDPKLAGLKNLVLLAVTRAGDQAFLHTFRCEVKPLNDLSANGVLAAIVGHAKPK